MFFCQRPHCGLSFSSDELWKRHEEQHRPSDAIQEVHTPPPPPPPPPPHTHTHTHTHTTTTTTTTTTSHLRTTPHVWSLQVANGPTNDSKVPTQGLDKLSTGCTDCGKIFKTRQTLNRHRRKLHNAEYEKVVWRHCFLEGCSQKFIQLKSLSQHMELHHKIDMGTVLINAILSNQLTK